MESSQNRLGCKPQIAISLDHNIGKLASRLDIPLVHQLNGVVPLFLHGILSAASFPDIACYPPLEAKLF